MKKRNTIKDLLQHTPEHWRGLALEDRFRTTNDAVRVLRPASINLTHSAVAERTETSVDDRLVRAHGGHQWRTPWLRSPRMPVNLATFRKERTTPWP